MSDTIKALILEDDQGQRTAWQREADDFNSSLNAGQRAIELEFAGRLDEAKRELETWRFDAFVSDLRVPANENAVADADSGNAAVRFAVENAACPVAVFTGFPQDFETPFEGWPGKSFERSADAMQEVLRWISAKKALLEALSTLRHHLRRDAAAMFHRRLWAHWETDAHDVKAEVLLRQMTSYLTESLSLDEEEFPAVVMEHYFVPSLRDRLHTGDLVRHDEKIWVLMNAPCDLVRTYPEFLLLVRCDDLTDEKLDKFSAETLSNGAKSQLERYLRQNHEPSTHFLPPLKDAGPWFANFAVVASVSSGQAEDLVANRLASISPMFGANLRHRFLSYLGRPGQPLLDSTSVHRSIRLAGKNAL